MNTCWHRNNKVNISTDSQETGLFSRTVEKFAMIVLGAVAVSVWPHKGEVESSAQVTLERQTPTDERSRHLFR